MDPDILNSVSCMTVLCFTGPVHLHLRSHTEMPLSSIYPQSRLALVPSSLSCANGK